MPKNKKPRKKEYAFKTLKHKKIKSKKNLDEVNAQIAELYKKGNVGGALSIAEQGLLNFPNNLPLLKNAGVFSALLGKLKMAEKYYKAILVLSPNDKNTNSNLGSLLAEQERYDEAEYYFSKALMLQNNSIQFNENLARCLKEQKKFSKAKKYYTKIINLDPNNFEALHGLAVSSYKQKEFMEAKSYYKKMTDINPNYAGAHNNLGLIFKKEKQFIKAKEYFDNALNIDNKNFSFWWNLSLLELSLGNLKQGYELYEYRYHPDNKDKNTVLPSTLTPHYQGDILTITNKHLLICPEQGIGDEVMFASVLPDLAVQVTQNPDTKITLACDPRLIPLFQRSFDFLTVIPKDPANQYKSLEGMANYWLFIGSLPKYYRNALSDFDKHQPYLKANSDLVNRWQTRLGQLPHKVNIGISWAGGKIEEHKRDRSLTLEQLTPILEKIGQQANIINLQYGDHTQAIEQFSTQTGITIHDWEDADPLKDLDNFAAQISALDLVISIDNSTVHFAGALGVQTLVMLPFNQDWRWGEDRDDSYWYPHTMKLFRQSEDGDWESVIGAVVDNI